jgi:7-carboxy-7-deazaguanine synthase
MVEPAEILDRMEAFTRTENICITGGEPFTQHPAPTKDLALRLIQEHHTIDVFTNGTRLIPTWCAMSDVSVIMDWKLAGSGEGKKAIEQRETNIVRFREKDWIKFVVKDKEDFYEAIEVWASHKSETGANWCIGTAWERMPEADILSWILQHELPWRVNVQVHKYIFDPSERQI